MALASTSNREQLTSLLRRHFSILRRDTGQGFLPETSRPELEIAQQRAICGDLINDLQNQVAANNYSGAIRLTASEVLGISPADLDKQPSHIMADTCSGVARAEIEALRHSIFRLTERLLPYVPADPLFVELKDETPTTTIPPTQKPDIAAQGPSLERFPFIPVHSRMI
jgi:hypothetical protein